MFLYSRQEKLKLVKAKRGCTSLLILHKVHFILLFESLFLSPSLFSSLLPSLRVCQSETVKPLAERHFSILTQLAVMRLGWRRRGRWKARFKDWWGHDCLRAWVVFRHAESIKKQEEFRPVKFCMVTLVICAFQVTFHCLILLQWAPHQTIYFSPL